MPKQRSVPSFLGAVPLQYVKDLKDDSGTSLLGRFRSSERIVELLEDMAPLVERTTLWHEWLHLVMSDTGARNGLTEAQEETICDTLSTAIVGLGGPE